MATSIHPGPQGLLGLGPADRRFLAHASTALSTRAMLGTYLFVGWVTFTTTDPVAVAGLPFKLFLLALALAMWFPKRSGERIPLAIPVVIVAVVVPVVWAIVATYHAHPYAGQTPSPTGMTLEHCSRFVYLLIYLPIADFTLGKVNRALYMWLVPVIGFCALTWALFVLYTRLGVDLHVTITRSGPGKVGPLLGVVTPPGITPARIFFANHILMIPAIAVLIGWSLAKDYARRPLLFGALLFVLATLYPVHTRGLTIAVLVVLVSFAALSWRIGSPWPVAMLAVSLVVLLSTSFDTRATSFLQGNRSDPSAQDRVVQAPQLLDEFKRRPVLGAGLGATLPSGYYRSPTEPYQFELNYHQLLFQTGIVGLVVILGMPLLAMGRCLLAMTRLAHDERALATGAVAGIAGILFASATNPYLVSSFGMLALAVLLALCARAIHLAATAPVTPGAEAVG